MGQHDPAKGQLTPGVCGNSDAMENLGPVSLTGKEVKAPICKHLHACLFLDLCSTSHLEVTADTYVQKALHIFQSSSAWGHGKERGQHNSLPRLKRFQTFSVKNLLKQLMKATVDHSENWPREVLKNNFTRLVEMTENLEWHHLAHTWDYTLREKTSGIIT